MKRSLVFARDNLLSGSHSSTTLRFVRRASAIFLGLHQKIGCRPGSRHAQGQLVAVGEPLCSIWDNPEVLRRQPGLASPFATTRTSSALRQIQSAGFTWRWRFLKTLSISAEYPDSQE